MGIIKIECPKCYQHYSVDVSIVGHNVECSVCGNTFTVGTNNVISWDAEQQDSHFSQAQQSPPQYGHYRQQAFTSNSEKDRNSFASIQNDMVMCSCDNKQYTKKQILEIAKNQKWFIFFILLFFVFQSFSRVMWDRFTEIDSSLAIVFRFLLILGAFGFFAAEAFFCIKMMLALQSNTTSTVILAILSFLPLIGIFIALALNSNANKVLAAAGLNVGFFGVSLSTISQLQSP